MNEKIKSFFEKVGLCMSALFLFVLGLFLGNRFQNKGIGTASDPGTDEGFRRDREQAEHAASTISGIIKRVKARGGENEEESGDI